MLELEIQVPMINERKQYKIPAQTLKIAKEINLSISLTRGNSTSDTFRAIFFDSTNNYSNYIQIYIDESKVSGKD